MAVAENVVCQEYDEDDAKLKAKNIVSNGSFTQTSTLLIDHLRSETKWAGQADWPTDAWKPDWRDRARE